MGGETEKDDGMGVSKAHDIYASNVIGKLSKNTDNLRKNFKAHKINT